MKNSPFLFCNKKNSKTHSGSLAAERACEEFGVASQNDAKKLADAKAAVYLKGFTEGVMLVGELAGEKVSDAKPKLKATLVAAGDGIIYSEPERAVVSRSGDACVVALTDQWYLTYGEDEWAASARECLAGEKEKTMFFFWFLTGEKNAAPKLIHKFHFGKKIFFLSSQHLRRRVPPRLRAHSGLAPPVGVLAIVRARDAAAVGPDLSGKREKRRFFIFGFFSRRLFSYPSFFFSHSLFFFLSSPTEQKKQVESLSDSTIYMAYYCVAHLFQGGDMYGNAKNADSSKQPLSAEELTDEVWDFIFRGAAFPASVDAESEAGEAVKRAKREFEYWYPMVRRKILDFPTFQLFFHGKKTHLEIKKLRKKQLQKL